MDVDARIEWIRNQGFSEAESMRMIAREVKAAAIAAVDDAGGDNDVYHIAAIEREIQVNDEPTSPPAA